MVTNKLVSGAEKKRIIQYQRERESLRNTIQILSSRVSVLWKIAREKEREISELDGMYKKLRKDFNSFDKALRKINIENGETFKNCRDDRLFCSSCDCTLQDADKYCPQCGGRIINDKHFIFT